MKTKIVAMLLIITTTVLVLSCGDVVNTSTEDIQVDSIPAIDSVLVDSIAIDSIDA